MNNKILTKNLNAEILIFLIPLLIFVEIKIVGRLFLSEILLFLISPFLFMLRGYLLKNINVIKIISIGLLWFISQIVSDIVMGTQFEDLVRGWLKIFIFLINFSVLYILINNQKRRFIIFTFGLIAGKLLAFIFNPNLYSLEDPWKFGYGFPITLFFIIMIDLYLINKYKYFAYLTLLIVGVLNFYLGYRSLAGITLMALSIIFLKMNSNFNFENMSNKKIIYLIGYIIILILIIIAFYTFSASLGLLGAAQLEKYELQVMGDFGFILAGRSEIFGSIQAIMDSPILGHGSWAKNSKYLELMYEQLNEYGYRNFDFSFIYQGDGLIPTHSYFFGAWVEAGFLGAIFWLWILGMTIKALLIIIRNYYYLVIFSSFIIFNFIWDILFSPFGAEARLIVPFYLCLMIYIFNCKRFRV